MQTCKEIEATYRVINGRIASPGKFQGEPRYAPYFYLLALDGAGLWNDDNECEIEIQPEDYKEFPELVLVVGGIIRLWEDNNGFVYCRT